MRRWRHAVRTPRAPRMLGPGVRPMPEPDPQPRRTPGPLEPQVPDRGPERDTRTGRRAAPERIRHQATWVDLQIRQAVERGAFDGLPGYGKPIDDLGEHHDPDWWVKRLVEREQISVLPPALAVRKDDAELDDRLDGRSSEREVRRELEEFNARVRSARIQPLGGPPMITREREVEAELERWRERRDARRAAAAERVAASRESPDRRRRPRWLRLRSQG